MAEQSTAVTKNPPKAEAKSDKAEAKWKTAAEVLGHLRETGTPRALLEGADEWIESHKDAQGAAFYEWLAARPGMYGGTIKKAGKFVFGSQFEPETAIPKSHQDKMDAMRDEIERLKEQLTRANTDKLSYIRQRDIANEKAQEMTRKVMALKVGKSRDELVAAGVE